MKTLLTLLVLLSACGDDQKWDRTPEVIIKREAAVFGADPTLKLVVYRQPAGPGKPEQGCIHALLHSKETVGMVTKGVLTIFPTRAPLMTMFDIEKGAAPGKWEETWMAAGCP